MSSAPTNQESTFIFPAFTRLAEFLLDNDIAPETAGYIVGRANMDLWIGATAEAQKVLGDAVFDEIELEPDFNTRFQLLVEKYKDATGIDMFEQLNTAAEAIVNEIIAANNS